MKQAVEIDPNFADGWAKLARRYVWEARMASPTGADSALALARNAVDLEPRLSSAHYALASAYTVFERMTDAEVSFRYALELDPEDLGVLNDLSFFGSYYGELATSLRLAVRAVALVPNSANVWWHGTVPLAQLGDVRRFEGWLSRAEGLAHSRLDVARVHLAVRQGRMDEAMERALGLLEAYPGQREPEYFAREALVFLGSHRAAAALVAEHARAGADQTLAAVDAIIAGGDPQQFRGLR